MISIKSKLLLASTALVAVASVASAADTAVTTSGAVTGTDATQLTLTDADTSTSVTAGDTVSTDADIATEIGNGDNTGAVITGDVADITLNINHNVTTGGASAIDQTVAGTINVDAAATVTGGTNAILVSTDSATTINVAGTLVGAIDTTAATSANTTVTVTGTAADITLGAGTNSVTLTGGTADNITGGAGDDTLTSTGTSTINNDVTAFETVNVTDGTLDADGNITATTTTISSGATLDMANTFSLTGTTVNVDGTLTTAGTVTIDADTVNVSSTGNLGDVTLADGSAHAVNVTAGTTGAITGGNDVDTLTVSGAKATLTGNHDLAAGADVVNLSSTVATTAATADATTIDGDFDTGAGIDDINVTSGFINITGNLDNTGADLDTLDVSNGAKLRVAGTSATGTLTVAEGGIFHTVGAATLGGNATIDGTYIADAGTDANTSNSDITVSSTGKATFNGTSGAENLNVAGDLTIATGTTTVDTASDITGKVTVKAVNAGTGATFAAGTLTDAATKQANVTLELDTNTTASGKLSATGAFDFSDTKVALTAAQGATVAGTYAGIVSGSAAATALTAANESTSNALYTYTWAANGNDYDLTVALKNAGVTTLEGAVATNKGLAAELERTGAGTASNTAALYQEVFKQSDTEGALETLASDVSGGLVGASFDAAKGVANSVETRLASLRGQSGIAAGDMQSNGAMWVKAFGSTANQDERDGSSGYDADTLGLAYGVDSDNIVKGATVGLAVSYAGSEVDSDAGSETDVSSYQLTAYASKDLGNRAYIDAQVGIAYNEFETDRTDFLGDKYSADFEGMQYSAALEAGRSMDYMGATVTPKFGLQYITQEMDSYNETGSGANGLSVDNKDVSALYARVGADVAWNFSTAGGTHLKPYVSAAVSHDLIADEMEARTSFLAGGNAFTVEGADVEETAFEIGTGIEIMSVGGVDLTVAYDGVFKEDFDSHAGSVKARWAF